MADSESQTETDPTADSFRVGLVQLRSGGDAATNLQRTIASVRDAREQGAQVVCLQELFSLPYFCQVEDGAHFDLAESIPGPTTRALGDLAAELSLVIIAPIFERRASGVYHNSAAIIDADGSLAGVYRKMHIPHDPQFFEKFYFTPGDLGFRVFPTRHARIGVLICWDQWFPEAARLTALAGAEIIFYPTAIGWLPGEKSTEGATQLRAWQNVQVGHAIANELYVAAVNRVGMESSPPGGIEFWGSSFVVDPRGDIIAQAGDDEEATLVVDCDRRRVESQRRDWPFWRDRRIDVYGALARHPDGGAVEPARGAS